MNSPERRRLRQFADLTGSISLAALGTAFAALSVGGPLRILVGFAVSFFLPGYGLTAILWRHSGGLGPGGRIALSVGLSASLSVLTDLILSVAGIGINFLAPLLLMSYETLVFSAIAVTIRWRRREGLPPDLLQAVTGLLKVFRSDKPLWVTVTALLALAAGLVFAIAITPPGRLSTQFYLLGPDGTASTLPERVFVNQSASIVIGIFNGADTRLSVNISVCLAPTNETCSATAVPISWEGVHTLEPRTLYILSANVDVGERTEIPFGFAVSLTGTFQLTFSLNATGVDAQSSIALTVVP